MSEAAIPPRRARPAGVALISWIVLFGIQFRLGAPRSWLPLSVASAAEVGSIAITVGMAARSARRSRTGRWETADGAALWGWTAALTLSIIHFASPVRLAGISASPGLYAVIAMAGRMSHQAVAPVLVIAAAVWSGRISVVRRSYRPALFLPLYALLLAWLWLAYPRSI